VHSNDFPPINYMSAGLTSICDMLASDTSGLGWNLPEVKYQGQSVELRKVLGHGGFSVVYQGKLGDRDVVVKHFRKQVTEPLLPHITKHRDTEIVMLQKAANQGISGVTKFIGLSMDKQAILVVPIGVHFARSTNDIIQVMTTSDPSYRFCTAKNLCEVVDILENLHKNKIVHRDVRVANFFWDPHTEKAFINDFGAAVDVSHERKCEFVGARHHAPSYIRHGLLSEPKLQRKFEYYPRDSDDLHMLVCTLFQLVHTAIYEGIVKCSEEQELELWEQYLQVPFWKTCCDAALAKKYDELKVQIHTILK